MRWIPRVSAMALILLCDVSFTLAGNDSNSGSDDGCGPSLRDLVFNHPVHSQGDLAFDLKPAPFKLRIAEESRADYKVEKPRSAELEAFLRNAHDRGVLFYDGIPTFETFKGGYTEFVYEFGWLNRHDPQIIQAATNFYKNARAEGKKLREEMDELDEKLKTATGEERKAIDDRLMELELIAFDQKEKTQFYTEMMEALTGLIEVSRDVNGKIIGKKLGALKIADDTEKNHSIDQRSAAIEAFRRDLETRGIKFYDQIPIWEPGKQMGTIMAHDYGLLHQNDPQMIAAVKAMWRTVNEEFTATEKKVAQLTYDYNISSDEDGPAIEEKLSDAEELSDTLTLKRQFYTEMLEALTDHVKISHDANGMRIVTKDSQIKIE